MPLPRNAVMLQQLVAAGGRCAYHGDYDWPGVRIGNLRDSRIRCAAVAFDANEYLAGSRRLSSGLALAGPEVEASWDDALTVAMRVHQLAIAEESLADGCCRI